MRNLTNTSSGSINVNTLSGGTAIEILNNNINLDINKASLSATTSANDQYIFEDSNGNTKKIFYSNLIGSSGSGLTAGNDKVRYKGLLKENRPWFKNSACT